MRQVIFLCFSEQGLYLIFADSNRIILTRNKIQQITQEFWANPEKISSEIKETIDFKRCDFCPLREENSICDALRPILPLIDILNTYKSFDKITAVYKDSESNILYLSYTSMHDALKYLSILSLMQYCQIGRTYWKYYYGITPICNCMELAKKLYLNMLWFNKNCKISTKKFLNDFISKITITSNNQVKRLNLICKNDVILNAFVNTQISTALLSMDIDKELNNSISKFEKELPV